MSNVKYFENRKEIDDKYKWSIDSIYESQKDIDADFEKCKSIKEKILLYKGKINTKEDVLRLFGNLEELIRVLDKINTYTHMKKDEDGNVSLYQSLNGKGEQLYYSIFSDISFIDTEIISKDDKFLEELVNSKELAHIKFKIEKLIKSKKHILSEEAEKILSMFGSSIEAPYNIAGIFKNVDLTFSKIKDENGNEVQLNEGNYSVFLVSKDRNIRRNTYETLYGTYRNFKNTLGTCLSTSITNDVLYSKARNFNSTLEGNLFSNNISIDVYKNAIEVMHENFDKIHRYISLKKKMLNVDKLMSYDLYVPLFENLNTDISYEECIDLSIKALKPLGDEYLNIFKEGINNKWIDVYTNKGKRSGAYSSGSYDTDPYILLNYSNSFNDVSTFVHEMGHSIHSYYSKKNQTFFNYRYPIFSAEIASTCNEHLLNTYMQNNSEGDIKLYFINKEIENIRTTVCRQMLFAEFELIVHERVEQEEVLTCDDFCSIWKDLNIKYYGKDLEIDDYIIYEWSRIPHFYSAYYVYQYATGYAASFAFAKDILSNSNEARENYINNFLKQGGSSYPIDILKNANVDMTTKEPMQKVMDRFSELIGILEKNV